MLERTRHVGGAPEIELDEALDIVGLEPRAPLRADIGVGEGLDIALEIVGGGAVIRMHAQAILRRAGARPAPHHVGRLTHPELAARIEALADDRLDLGQIQFGDLFGIAPVGHACRGIE